MKKTDLCGSWTLTDMDGKKYDAIVPGCVHTDIIKDENIFYRDNFEKYQWIEEKEWEYTKEFDVESIEGYAYIVFECLDVYCDVYLNDSLIGSFSNMYIPHKISVDGTLKVGKNELKVHFYSPVEAVKDFPERAGAFTTERMNTRRMQCTYGWDWVARFLTCGISKPVYLMFDNDFEIDNVYIYTSTSDSFGAVVDVHGETRNYKDGKMVYINVYSPSGEKLFEKKECLATKFFVETICIENPQLWYPNGYGEQPLYLFEISSEDDILFSQKFGIRTVRIIENRDEAGSEYYNKCIEIKQNPSADEYDRNDEFCGFILAVNGIKIMCKGSNYVPTEPFVSEETDKKITAVLELAKECGTNILRVWGGGKFEREHFYSECDRLGIMIIHDFMMACGEYPEHEKWFIDELISESEYAAKLIRNHPSLMWWQGDNENAIRGTFEDKNYHGKLSAYEGILENLKKYDYSRRFLVSSPYGGKLFASKTVGTTHNTQFLNYVFDYIEENTLEDYKEYLGMYLARFVSEEPSLGAICKNSMLRLMTEEDIYAEDMKMWYKHTRTNPYLKHEVLEYIVMLAEKILGGFKNSEDKYFKLKYVQYEWIRVSLENLRRNKWFSSGVVYWMLNDCWPAASGWALIDYFCMPKASYYSFKRAAKPVITSISREKDKKLFLTLCSDDLSINEYRLEAYKLNYNSNSRETVFLRAISNLKNDNLRLELNADISSDELLICDLFSDFKLVDRSFYKDGILPISKTFEMDFERIDVNSIKIKADRYIHAVELDGEYIFSDNYFTLLKDEEKVVKVKLLGENKEIKALGYTF